jgi:hypothetical protein
MPAKDTVLLHLSDTEATTKMIRKDVDNLVQNIKDNLKLSFEAVQHESKSAATAMGSSRPLSSYADYQYNTVVDTNPSLPRYPAALSGGGSRKARSYMSSKGASRASPYALPGAKCDCDESGRPGSWAARKRYPSMSAAGKPKIELDDPLEMLQELIRLASSSTRFSAPLPLKTPPFPRVVASLRMCVSALAVISAARPLTANLFNDTPKSGVLGPKKLFFYSTLYFSTESAF